MPSSILDLLGGAPPPDVLAVVALAGLFGGFVRGYSGFGFALASVPILALALPPVIAVPAVLPVELAIGLATLPAERHHVVWPAWTWLVLGTLMGTPVGLTVLTLVPPEPMRVAIGLAVVLAVLVLWRRPALGTADLGRLPLIGAGLVSGLLNGGTAMSGPPAIIALLGSPLGSRQARGTLIAFIALSAGLGTLLALWRGVMGAEAALSAALLVPTAALGGGLGILVFGRTPERHYRPASLAILGLVALGAIASSALTLAHPTTVQP